MVLRLSTGGKETAVLLLDTPVILNNLSTYIWSDLMLRKPWTVVSSLFMQLDPCHLFWNLADVWVLGRLFMDLLGGRRLVGHTCWADQRRAALRPVPQSLCPACVPTPTVATSSAPLRR
ncbi:MAG: hypothetical protein IPP26_12515 [Flavobacteriales bacterium]|nr:hypothetical protein [Flavobacteriales bacterium]